MNDICQNIIDLFSGSSQLISCQEDCDELIAEYQIDNFDKVLSENINLPELNQRDKLGIYYFEDDENSISFNSEKAGSWETFIDDLKTVNKKGEVKIKIKIAKQLKNNYISIYYIDKFTEYIKKLSLLQFLSVINNRFGNSLIFEIQNENFKKWETNSIAFIPKKSKPTLNGIGEIIREKRIEEARFLCYCELDKYGIIPEDLFCSDTNAENQLQSIFQKAYLLYTFSFITDYSGIKNNSLEYKLNGFKTLWGAINIQKLNDVNVDINSCRILQTIYQWLYLGGNSTDKINIARNIISLNIKENTLEINNTTFDSILSNYKIYEKENVKQYIQVRNKLSELLIDLQEKIGNVMDSFISDFKKNLITLVSFFISVVVIRVVSKGDFIGGFTNEIILLSMFFLLISVGILIYSRWELTQKINLYNKHYNQIKERYKEILSTIELDNIFEECDPQKDHTHHSFIVKQKKFYSILWTTSIILLFIFLVFIYLLNNYLVICPIIKILICCILNICR